MTSRLFRLLLFALFFQLFSISVWGVEKITADSVSKCVYRMDTTPIIVRYPDSLILMKCRSLKEYDYSVDLDPANSKILWKRILQFLQNLLNDSEDIIRALPFIFKLLLIGLIVFIIYLLLQKTKFHKLFYTEKNIETPQHWVVTSEAQIDDFDAEIKNLVEQQQYRRAVRMLYLATIDRLTKATFIVYSKEKTNFDYIYELKNSILVNDFIAITSIYNSVWYGHFEIDKFDYDPIEITFKNFLIAVDNEKES